jgi:DNA-directed RNA polymerase II subunit RPB2
MYVDIEQQIVKNVPGEEPVHSTVHYSKTPVGDIPIMLRSKYCILNDIPGDNIEEFGECIHDHGGYFIVNGTEKVEIGFKFANETRFSSDKRK